MARVTPDLIRIAARQVRVWRGAPPMRDAAPNLLLLHGGLGDARWHWHTVWETLADSFSLVAPDLPRFGSTVELPNASFDELIEWTARVQELVRKPQ
jgi:pimeloyl-ACP methyl ester carboxylesterase